MRHSNAINRTRRTNAGFTLVELLTVVAIIVLLIGILVPAVNAVRTSARKTVTDGMIQTLSTGLETFQASQMVGGTYVPSVSDTDGSGVARKRNVMSPYANLVSGPTGNFPITGAGLLVWGLAGADLLGAPGFKTFRTNSSFWADDTDTIIDTNESGAYALDQNTFEPKHARVTPFVDLSKVQVTNWKPQAETQNGLGSFEIPAEAEAAEALGAKPSKRNYPMFVDSFGGPILYWRADPAGVAIADRPMNGDTGLSRGKYHFLDNGAILRDDIGGGAGTGEDPLVLRASNEPHAIYWPMMGIPGGGGATQPQEGFALYIQNKDIQAKPTPYRPDSYLMVSAGPDGRFGTADDIANFPHNGAELKEPN